MSSRSPMWFCHQCHAEMRPLMVPDPVCASCHSSFVEKIEDSQNDPREFATGANGPPAANRNGDGFDDFLVALQTLLNRGMEPADQMSHRQQSPSRMTFQFGSVSGRPRQATFAFGSSSPHLDIHPPMSEFLRSDPTPFSPDDTHHHPGGGQRIDGHLFSQYLVSLLGQTNHPMMPLFMSGMPESGRMGDYVFSQDALDQIITQIMESTNSTRPVPATEEVIEQLPQEVLLADSPLLTKDCAVCKDQFQLETEDPEQQVVVTLPCKHPFHKACIMPWLKSSGTCPVCRYALVPQPGQQQTPSNPSTASSSSSSSRSSDNATRARSQSPSGLGYQRRSPRPASASVPGLGNFASIFGIGNPRHHHHHHHHRPSSSNPRTSTPQPSSPREQTSPVPRSRSRNDQSRSQRDRQPHFPGQWTEDMSDLD